MLVIAPCVGGARQFHDPLPHLRGEGVGRLASSVSMGQGPRSFLAVGRQEPPQVPLGYSYYMGCLSDRTTILQHHIQQADPLFLSRAQYQSFHGLTFSQKR